MSFSHTMHYKTDFQRLQMFELNLDINHFLDTYWQKNQQ